MTGRNAVIVLPRGISRWLRSFESGDFYRATSGDFVMATDRLADRRRCR